jgi:hypothetical protein
MNTGMKILLGLIIALVLIVGSTFLYVIGVKNTFVLHEEGISAQYEQNQNNLASYTNKVLDIIQVPKMAKEHIKEVATAYMQGRYGKEGSKAVIQLMVEQNSNVDPVLYRQIQQVMEAGRDSFEMNQKTLIDKCRVYKTYYQTIPESLIATFFGYPKYDASKCKPVITDDTAKSFETKRTAPIQIQ